MASARTGPDGLREAAAAGDPAAQFEVASRYAEERGVGRDPARALAWYECPAAAGLTPAQFRLGSLHEEGLGTQRNFGKAVEWYRRAAEAGNAKAMHNLAVLLAGGASGSSDLAAAAEWFRWAADHGVRDSQFNLAVLHVRGLGVTQDFLEAYRWFAVAARSSDKQSAKRRDAVAASLGPDDLKKVQAAAEAFRPVPLEVEADVVVEPEGGWGSRSPAGAHSDVRPVENAQAPLAAFGCDAAPAISQAGRPNA